MEKYYEKRDQRMGKIRFCKHCKTTQLSRYNDTNTCSSCKQLNQSKATADMINMFANASLSA